MRNHRQQRSWKFKASFGHLNAEQATIPFADDARAWLKSCPRIIAFYAATGRDGVEELCCRMWKVTTHFHLKLPSNETHHQVLGQLWWSGSKSSPPLNRQLATRHAVQFGEASAKLRLDHLPPALTWAAREYYRQNDTADALGEHLRAAKALWTRALAGDCDADHCLAQSREFQNAIYHRRASSPLIMPLLYRFKRLHLEDDMNEAAANFLAEYQIAHCVNAAG